MPSPPRDPAPSEALYDAVAAGLLAYARAAFRVRILGGRGLPVGGSILVATHRSDTDAPVVASSVYLRARMWDRSAPRLHFAARDDLFVRGVLAALAPGLPPAARGPLAAVDPGPFLRRLRVHPLARATTLKLGQALSLVPGETRLEELVPDALLGRLAEAARRAGLAPPRTAGQALEAGLVDELWAPVSPADLRGRAAEEIGRRRSAEATATLRGIVDVVRAGEALLLFPEGSPSPDGRVGPVERGVELLVRRGRPRRLLPVGVAYDPLTGGRPRAYVAFGQAEPPPRDDVEGAVLAALRAAMPLTCGQVVSGHIVEAARAGRADVAPGDLDRALADEVEEAGAAGRPLEPALLAPASRRARLTEALAALVALGAAERAGPRRLRLRPARLLAPGPLLRLARERESVRPAGSPPVP